MEIRRLISGDEELFHQMVATMAAVFEERCDPFDRSFAARLLARPDFWAVAVIEVDSVTAGVTAYALPMTRADETELFIYDVAVRVDRQRQGVGRALLNELHRLAATAEIRLSFVPAEDEDTHAIDFYRALGGSATAVTFFTFDTGR